MITLSLTLSPRGRPFAELTAPGAPVALFRGKGEGEVIQESIVVMF